MMSFFQVRVQWVDSELLGSESESWKLRTEVSLEAIEGKVKGKVQYLL